MKIKFSGEVEFNEKPDDRGTVDVWLINAIRDAITAGPELDDVFANLNLSWKVGRNRKKKELEVG